MSRTSIGFHTFTIFRSFIEWDANLIFEDIKTYCKNTENARLQPTDESKKTFRVFYIPDRGIHWQIRFCNEWQGFKTYIVEATINPKLLAGIRDYITAANQDYLKIAENEFNLEAQKISKLLGRFSSFQPNRIDYCINFDLNELGINCTPTQMIELIKRSNIPSHFEERKEYDKYAHRKKDDENSFYLESDSVVINCYYKYGQLLKKFPSCSSLEDSRNVIRFEIQCKYIKLYHMMRMISNNTAPNNIITYDMLSDEISKKVITDYFGRVIMHGDYYSLRKAIDKIKKCNFRRTKEERLIWALKQISTCRGISKVRVKLRNDDFNAFNCALRELTDIGINPVVIPRDWNIPSIANLLDVFNRIVKISSNNQVME